MSRMTLYRTWPAACTLLLGGCLSTGPTGPRHADAPRPPPSAQLATMYLAYLGGPQARMGFSVDGQPFFSAPSVSYSWIQLPPGQHSFRAQVGFMQQDLAAPGDSSYNRAAQITLDTEADQAYYLEFSTEGEMTRTDEHFILGVGIVGPQYTERAKRFEQVDAEVGAWNLRPMTYIEPASRRLPAKP